MLLAVVLSTDSLTRVYTGLSLLASADEGSRALATFGSLPVLADPQLQTRASREELADATRFAATLDALLELCRPRISACSAAVECLRVEHRFPVTSMPRWLSELPAGAHLVVV